ncbi:MAG: glycosyltransferase [Candidatus Omnitrophota bacterium]
MKVAVIHDWIMSMRGGEKCLEVFCELFPEATVFTLAHKKGVASQTIENMDIRTSFIQSLPGAMSAYRSYLPLFPRAIRSFDLSGYDFVLSSSHCVAKGVTIPAGVKHICYCYTPMRYIWFFFNEYFGKEKPIKRFFISAVTQNLKAWDLETNKSVDYFVAISDNVRNRISNIYSKDSYVIYPPVDIHKFSISSKDHGYYLIVSGLVPYKRIDLAIEAFNMTARRLVIVGAGNVEKKLKKAAKPNIEFAGQVDDERLKEYYYNCTALIFPGEEDFGIVPVEAQACGKPVIAYGRGGALETVIPLEVTPSTSLGAGRSQGHQVTSPPTGVFFYEQTPQALINAIETFEQNRDKFMPQKIRENSLRFSRDIFKQRIKDYITDKLNQQKLEGAG